MPNVCGVSWCDLSDTICAKGMQKKSQTIPISYTSIWRILNGHPRTQPGDDSFSYFFVAKK